MKSPNRASVVTEPSKILVSIQNVKYQSKSKSIMREIEAKLAPISSTLTDVSQKDLTDLLFAYCQDSDNEAGMDYILMNYSDLAMECSDESDLAYTSENLALSVDGDGESSPSECISYYLFGYVAHKMKKFTDCDKCRATLTEYNHASTGSNARLVMLKSYGGLSFPSETLQSLLRMLENCVVKHCTISADMFELILNDVFASNELMSLTIGCSVHSCALTARCIYFYVVTRLHFVNRNCNKRRLSRQEKKKCSKLSKLT